MQDYRVVVQMDSGTKNRRYDACRKHILAVAAIIASWPAIVFVLIYYTDHNTGTLIVGGLFSLLAAVLWGSADWVGQRFAKLTRSKLS